MTYMAMTNDRNPEFEGGAKIHNPESVSKNLLVDSPKSFRIRIFASGKVLRQRLIGDAGLR